MEQVLKAALELRRNGELLESNRVLSELVKEHPEHAMLHYECAWSYDILAKEREAVPFYERALELGLPDQEAVNAYAQLGLIYRLHGRLTDSRKVLMKGMGRFLDAGLLKAVYAFTMYELGKQGEAIRWMTKALLDSAADPEVLLNRRAIGYIGSNLEFQKNANRPVSYVRTQHETAEDRTIVEKVEEVLKVFEPTYFHGAWVFEFDRYDLHFTDPDDETRRAAIAAFAVMVGIWETGSAGAFAPQHERKYSGNYDPTAPHFELNGYVSAFYTNFASIQQEFPVMTAYIIDSLNAIDERSEIGLEQKFPEMDSSLFRRFREEILLTERQSKKKLPPFEDFLREIGWNLSHRKW